MRLVLAVQQLGDFIGKLIGLGLMIGSSMPLSTSVYGLRHGGKQAARRADAALESPAEPAGAPNTPARA